MRTATWSPYSTDTISLALTSATVSLGGTTSEPTSGTGSAAFRAPCR